MNLIVSPEFAAAFIALQKALRPVIKDSKNSQFGNRKYASLDAIYDTVRGTCADHDCALTQDAEPSEDGSALFVRARLIYKTGESMTSTVYIPLAKRDAQGAGAALTYGRRYSTAGLLCIVCDDDDDGNAAVPPKAASVRDQVNAAFDDPYGAPPSPSPGKKASAATQRHGWTGTPADHPMPFGDFKGVRIGDRTADELKKLLKWCRDPKDPARVKKFADLAEDIATVLMDQSLGTTATKKPARTALPTAAEPDFSDYPPALNDEDQSDLPF